MPNKKTARAVFLLSLLFVATCIEIIQTKHKFNI